MQHLEEIREYLEGALSNIEKGWCQGQFKDRNRAGEVSYCLVGALANAMGVLGIFGAEVNPFNLPLYVNVHNYLQSVLIRKHGENRLAYWNDTPGRTQEEVADLYRAAIKDIIEEQEAVDS